MSAKLRKRAVSSKARAAGKHRPARREIARRAYQIFLGRGGNDGHDLEDWLQAEAELTGRRN
ncbi:MAG: DUF2934 domain-containing protein [Chloroflexi bacterium]|nr:MAG: DUF2934 domain-containing protein [Chloroflexota bacterium]